MAGVLGIYGLIVAVILANKIDEPVKPNVVTLATPYETTGNKIANVFVSGAQYSAFAGFAHLSAGLTCGLSGLAAGMAIGVVGDAGVRAVGQQPRLYVPTVLVLIFSEALALYGLIVGILVGIAKS